MCKGLYKPRDSARPCSEGLVPQDDEQVISPEVPLPEIPRHEADRQSITQVKAALDPLAVSRRRDFNTFSPSSGLSLHRRENQITNLLGLLPRCFCTASTVIDCGQRAGRAQRLLPACVYSSHHSSPCLCFLCSFTPRSLSSHYAEVTASPLPSLSCAPAQVRSIAFTCPSYLRAVQIKSFPW